MSTLVTVFDGPRRYSEPIPADLVAAAKAAGLMLDDGDHYVLLYAAGYKVGSVWGPASTDWFAAWLTADSVRVASRDAALRWVIGQAGTASVSHSGPPDEEGTHQP